MILRASTQRRLPTFESPTLIIASHHDYVHPLAFAERLQQILPHATLRVITAKSINKDQYKLDFREALSEFLTAMLVSR